jgi:hypothetical protein
MLYSMVLYCYSGCVVVQEVHINQVEGTRLEQQLHVHTMHVKIVLLH